MKAIVKLLRQMIKQRKLIFKLAKNDFKARYANSFLGILWAYIQPLVTILVFWFVFQKGFRTPPINDIPFILWFIPAYIPWIYFSDMLNSTANCMLEYSYLVKKVRFDVEIIPCVKIVSATFVHLFFICFTFFVYALLGARLTLCALQVLYYSAALMIFGLGLGVLVSSVTVLFKDFAQFVNVMLQIGFWAVPIYWNPDTMDEAVVRILKLNPLYYIVSGYRGCFVSQDVFWDHPRLSAYFWICTLLVWIIGCRMFVSLRPHFADEL